MPEPPSLSKYRYSHDGWTPVWQRAPRWPVAGRSEDASRRRRPCAARGRRASQVPRAALWIDEVPRSARRAAAESPRKRHTQTRAHPHGRASSGRELRTHCFPAVRRKRVGAVVRVAAAHPLARSSPPHALSGPRDLQVLCHDIFSHGDRLGFWASKFAEAGSVAHAAGDD